MGKQAEMQKALWNSRALGMVPEFMRLDPSLNHQTAYRRALAAIKGDYNEQRAEWLKQSPKIPTSHDDCIDYQEARFAYRGAEAIEEGDAYLVPVGNGGKMLCKDGELFDPTFSEFKWLMGTPEKTEPFDVAPRRLHAVRIGDVLAQHLVTAADTDDRAIAVSVVEHLLGEAAVTQGLEIGACGLGAR